MVFSGFNVDPWTSLLDQRLKRSSLNGHGMPCQLNYTSQVIWNCSELNSFPLKSVISDRTMVLAAINCRLCLMYSGRCINFEIVGSCIFDLINLV